MERVGDFLREHSIKPSYQRVKIYEFLLDSHDHPTVDNIYTALSESIPTLSRTTVYNTLKVFIEKGIASSINIDDTETRYDAITESHGHFKCQSCGEIFDIKVDFSSAIKEELPEFDITEQHLFIYGICDKCKRG